MKYKLLILWTDGDLELSPMVQDSYEEVKAQAKRMFDMQDKIHLIGWIEWEKEGPYGAELHFFIKESIFNGS